MTGHIEACDRCVRRGALVGKLAPRIAGLLLRRRRRPAGLLELPDDELIAAVAGHRAGEHRRWLEAFDTGAARAELSALGVGCACRHAGAYPSRLLDLADPPAALYVAGPLERLDALLMEPAVTVVGARNATPYGLEVARALGRGLAAAGVTVVSGLALGVDGAVHRGALRAGGRPLGVLAGGVDVPYPPSHRALLEQVAAAGCAVSELPPGTAPYRWSFAARNRIMAALGRLTVVIEAAQPSGTLITAGFAADLGRDVGVVPGRVTDRRAVGSNRLIRDGARLIRGPEDVLDELFGAGGRGSADGTAERDRRAAALALSRGRPEDHSLEAPVQRVLDAVEAGHRVDAISREAGLAAADVRAALGRLELMGLVKRDGLGLYERAAG